MGTQERWDEPDVEYVKPSTGETIAARSKRPGIDDADSTTTDTHQASLSPGHPFSSMSSWTFGHVERPCWCLAMSSGHNGMSLGIEALTDAAGRDPGLYID